MFVLTCFHLLKLLNILYRPSGSDGYFLNPSPAKWFQWFYPGILKKDAYLVTLQGGGEVVVYAFGGYIFLCLAFGTVWLVSNKLPKSRGVLHYMLSSPMFGEIWQRKEKTAISLCLFKDLRQSVWVIQPTGKQVFCFCHVWYNLFSRWMPGYFASSWGKMLEKWFKMLSVLLLFTRQKTLNWTSPIGLH